MKILVTGATGRVGANLVKALLEKGHQVRAFIYPGDASRMDKLDTYDVDGSYSYRYTIWTGGVTSLFQSFSWN